MKMQKFIYTILLLSFCLLGKSVGYSQTPIHLHCEHLVNPLGIDVLEPRFSWQLSGAKRGALQRSYQIEIGTDSIALSKGEASFWNSGKIDSDAILVAYKGKKM
ncbi:hypothetical protein [Flavobacterium granuli]|uniref:Alpha-rhamnosidase n=1 Tax=Flavobacterium granuli TaxID=280093 RepID=A0ABU1S2C0_9FLAO|nr:hypothetical protein [Flavobacterium granuli]MDR6845177.1 hypothetical protein [Flavobacterium granuli]